MRALPLAAALCLLAPSAGAQPAPFDIVEATIPDLQAAMAGGHLTSAALVEAYLARIAAYDRRGPALNAMIRLNPRARAEAEALDRERRAGRVRGPMHGIPIILKDNYDMADMPTSGGSLALAALRPTRDATVVRRLREAGAVIIGKSNLHELASGITNVSSLGGQTRNPYDPARCPGGSSGGTGAAIAASFAAVGWGSDTCGSIRIPAAYGSLVGLRPTQGLTSRAGILPLSRTQDVIGPLARTVGDLAIALDLTVGPDPADTITRRLAGRQIPRFTDSLRTDALKGARLGVFLPYFADADREIADTVRSAVRAMRALGAEVVDVALPGFDSLVVGSSVIDWETKWDLVDYLSAIPGAPVRSLREILDRGLYHEALEFRFRVKDTLSSRDGPGYRRSLARQAALRQRFVALLDSLKLDALVYPTMRQKAALVGEPQPGGTCQLGAHTGLPALSAPAGFSADGLPVGIELLGPAFSDARLVAMAYAFEQAGPRRRPPPSTPALVGGAPPATRPFVVTARSGAATARATFTYDAARGALGFAIAVEGVAPEQALGVALRRPGAGGGVARVVHRLAGPEVTRAEGAVALGAADRRALAEGKLLLTLLAAGAEAGDARLVVP